jgi:hypothetical protein
MAADYLQGKGIAKMLTAVGYLQLLKTRSSQLPK